MQPVVPVMLFPCIDFYMTEIDLFDDVEDSSDVNDEYDLLGEYVANLQEETSSLFMEPFDHFED